MSSIWGELPQDKPVPAKAAERLFMSTEKPSVTDTAIVAMITAVITFALIAVLSPPLFMTTSEKEYEQPILDLKKISAVAILAAAGAAALRWY